MKLTIIGNSAGHDVCTRLFPEINWELQKEIPGAGTFQNTDGYFLLNDITEATSLNDLPQQKPVFINAVSSTLKNLHAPKNVVRFNGWNGFLEHKVWELAGFISNEAATILTELGKQYTVVPDEPGFISARVIAMIVNEAYYALEEGVSDKDAIDVAMKLGTNYPYGPFEWEEKIGAKNIYNLLMALYKENERYKPATGLAYKALQ